MRRYLLLLTVCLIACAPARERPLLATALVAQIVESSPDRQVSHQPKGELRAQIRYASLAGRHFPYPLVRASVRGHDTWLIVDTGASHIVLADWIVQAVGLELEWSGQTGEGHAGEEIETFIVRDTLLAVEGWGALADEHVLAVKLPAVFERLGLGGVLSPQALAAPGYAVLMDMPAKELRLVPDSWSLDDSRGQQLAIGSDVVCAVGGKSRGAVFLVDAIVEGRAARLVVDTGAVATDVMIYSRAARPLVARSTAGGHSYTAGGKVTSREVEGATVSMGDVSRTVTLSLMYGLPITTCARDGHLGLDVLSDCVMLLSHHGFDARCSQ